MKSRLKNARGALLLEAIFALFLLAVVALSTLALLTQALMRFEVAESRGRALPQAGMLLEAPEAAGEPVVDSVGPGELRRLPDGTVQYLHPRGGVWLVPAPGRDVAVEGER